MRLINGKYRRGNRGFTLIELMVVVGIIAILVVVIMVALLPALMRSKENASRALLTSFGGALSGMKVLPNKGQFTKDAGAQLASSLDSRSTETASSQLLVFYLCPSRDVWIEAPLYKTRDYQPQFDPAQYKDLLKDSEGKLQYMADGWGTTLWYGIDKTGAFYLISAGEDMKFNTPDDLIYDGASNQVWKRESIPSGGAQSGGLIKGSK